MSGLKLKGVLLCFLLLILYSCDAPFDFTEIIDGETGEALSISPTSARVITNGTLPVSAEGGVSPYTFSIQDGKGTIDADSGEYTAPSKPGSDVIQVIDKYGNHSEAEITIVGSGNGDGPPVLSGTIDYIVTNVTGNQLSVNRKSTIEEQFGIKNAGSTAGSSPVQWEAYVSADTTFSTGDTLVSVGTIGALGAGKSEPAVAIEGVWPYEGSFYLIVRIKADDETKSGWDSGYNGVFSVTDTPDYSIFSVDLPVIQYGGNPNENMNAAGPAEQKFYIQNDETGGDGSGDITWTVYLSSDTDIDVGDAVLGNGTIIGGLPKNGESAALTFGDDDNLPASSGIYYILISISADDDYNTANNMYTSVQVFVWNTENSETDTTQDDTIGSAEDYHVILNADDVLTINGTIDTHPLSESDFFLIRTGPATTNLDIFLEWDSWPVLDYLDMYLFNSAGVEIASSKTNTKGSEPENEGDWTPPVEINSVYYLEVRIDKDTSGGDPYTLTIAGND